MGFYHRPIPRRSVPRRFLTMAGLYVVSMVFGAVIVRVPADGLASGGFRRAKAARQPRRPRRRRRSTWPGRRRSSGCLWMVLCMNVTAGIGVLGQAATMFQDMFGVDARQSRRASSGFCRIFNLGGRFFWSSVSDFIGRKGTIASIFSSGPSSTRLSRGRNGSGGQISLCRRYGRDHLACTAAASRRSRPTCATSSGRIRSAPSTDASSPHGRWLRSSARNSSTHLTAEN